MIGLESSEKFVLQGPLGPMVDKEQLPLSLVTRNLSSTTLPLSPHDPLSQYTNSVLIS